MAAGERPKRPEPSEADVADGAWAVFEAADFAVDFVVDLAAPAFLAGAFAADFVADLAGAVVAAFFAGDALLVADFADLVGAFLAGVVFAGVLRAGVFLAGDAEVDGDDGDDGDDVGRRGGGAARARAEQYERNQLEEFRFGYCVDRCS